jgi:hypothetical protein
MYRNDKLLKLAQHSSCQICGIEDGTVVSAHSNQLRDGKGRGLKAHDYRIAFLCHHCHSNLDQGTELTKQERMNIWDEAHRKTIGWLFENGMIDVRPFK